LLAALRRLRLAARDARTVRSDNLEAMDIITADGRLLHADADEHADLFWAVRGDGGNFRWVGATGRLDRRTFAALRADRIAYLGQPRT